MEYYFRKRLSNSFDEAIVKVPEELKKEGFGILTEIDVQETLKKKLDVETNPYRILGACNPPFAHKALQAEKEIGLMLPCNVIVYINDNSETVVAAIDPVASMQVIDNPQLNEIAATVRDKLKMVIERL